MSTGNTFKARLGMLTTTIALLCLALVLSTAVAEEPELRGDPEKAAVAWDLIEEGALLIDVRSAGEVEHGSIEGALHIPHDELDELRAAIGDDRSRSVVMYRGSGGRVGRVITALEAEGYKGLYNATGYDAMVATQP
ncbi:MAG: rhodanese-like domain-containing protein [Pseudomonadota bacterium]